MYMYTRPNWIIDKGNCLIRILEFRQCKLISYTFFPLRLSLFPFDSQCHRSNRSDQLLSAIISICRSTMWIGDCAIIGVSGIRNGDGLDIRRSSMQICWIPRGDAMVNYSVHIYVDLCRSVFSCSETIALWNGANENQVCSKLHSYTRPMHCPIIAIDYYLNDHQKSKKAHTIHIF